MTQIHLIQVPTRQALRDVVQDLASNTLLGLVHSLLTRATRGSFPGDRANIDGTLKWLATQLFTKERVIHMPSPYQNISEREKLRLESLVILADHWVVTTQSDGHPGFDLACEEGTKFLLAMPARLNESLQFTPNFPKSDIPVDEIKALRVALEMAIDQFVLARERISPSDLDIDPEASDCPDLDPKEYPIPEAASTLHETMVAKQDPFEF